MSNLIINCPHCDRPTPVELGKRVTSKQRCKHCKQFVGESDIVIGGRKPVHRKKVNVGGGQFGGERNLDEERAAGGLQPQPRRRFLLSHVIVTILIVGIGLCGVGFLLMKGYVNKKLAHQEKLKGYERVNEAILKNEADGFSPETPTSSMPSYSAIATAKTNLDQIMECKTPEELLKFVRNPEQVRDKLLNYYKEGRGTLPISNWLVAKDTVEIKYDDVLKIVIFYAAKDDGEPWWVVFKEGYDVSLLSAKSDGELQEKGRTHVSIAEVSGALNVRIFDTHGDLVVDKSEAALQRGAEFDYLKKLMGKSPLPNVYQQPFEDTRRMIDAAAIVTGFQLDEQIGDPKLDWESFVRYSDMEVDDFLKEKPTEPKEFRVLAMIDDYFNYEYNDYFQYTCVRLFDPTESFMFYGYVKKDADIGKTVREQVPAKQMTIVDLNAEGQRTPLDLNGMEAIESDASGLRKPCAFVTIKVRFPTPLQGDNQVEITEFTRRSWYLP